MSAKNFIAAIIKFKVIIVIIITITFTTFITINFIFAKKTKI